MATYTDTIGFNKGTATSGPLPHDANHRTGVISVRLDLADITTARAAASATALGAGDVLQVLDIPALTFVHAAGITLHTAEGGTLTLDLGDGDDADGWLDGVNGNATAPTAYASTLVLAEGTPNTMTGYTEGKLYTAADTIDIVFVNAADAVVLDVWAVVSYVG